MKPRRVHRGPLAIVLLLLSMGGGATVGISTVTSIDRSAPHTGISERPGRWEGIPAGLSCYEHARSEVMLDPRQALRLCASSPTPAPVDCYRRAVEHAGVPSDQAVVLCRCAESTAPVECYQSRSRVGGAIESRVAMCSPTRTQRWWSDCSHRRLSTARRARGGGPSRFDCVQSAREELGLDGDGARRLCAHSASVGPVRCYQTARDETVLDPSQVERLCRCASSAAPVDCFHTYQRNTLLRADEIVTLCSPTERGVIPRGCQ